MAISRKPDSIQDGDPLWYKDAVIYQLHVKSFFDGNNDGEGDFAGLRAKLDYIAQLGVNTVWLLPFYPSPRLDDGYDIAEYRGVHPGYGTLADVRKFIREAHQRGLRVITELVVNHTSDQHRWFQRARRAKPGSSARNYYVWSDNDQAYAGTRIIFCDTEKSNWTWDPVAGAYFWHRFYSHQPDLNYDHPPVLREIIGVMRFWLDMGVDGLRLDAVPYLVEREGTNNENLPETHAVLRRIREVLDRDYPGRLLLAEANQWPEDAQEYFGNGDECHMSFHFPLMPRMYMAIARADRFPITDIMQQTPDIPENCQWAIFLRNHDELTLEMVTSSERDYLWEVYAADRRARLNLGIRRRLAPLMQHDRRRIELMNSLLFSMPGTPVVYYGDELGMGDNIHLGDRNGVRTPMQWSPDRNGGFSRADAENLPLPLLQGPRYGYEAVNVESQQRDPHSLLNWTRRMLAIRSQLHAFGRGSLRFLFPGNRRILAYLREFEGATLLCVANLSDAPQPVELDLAFAAGRVPVELLGGTSFPTIGELPYLLTLSPYGFYWFELSASAAPPKWHASGPGQMPEHVTLVLRRRPGYELLAGSRKALCNQVAPQYLSRQRWYGGPAPETARLLYLAPLPGSDDILMAEFEVEPAQGSYFLPLALLWSEPVPAMAQQYALARVRRQADVGLTTDAYATAEFARAVLSGLKSGIEIPLATPAGATLRFLPEPGLMDEDWDTEVAVEWLQGDQSNSSMVVDGRAVLKLVRHVCAGIQPEAEMTRHLSRGGYRNAPRLLGEVVREDGDGTRHTLALLHAYIPNQGDAWTWTGDYLKRILAGPALAIEEAADYRDELRGYEEMAATIGLRLAQLHAVLARPADDPAFAPEVAGARDAREWAKAVRAMVEQALEQGGRQVDRLPDSDRPPWQELKRRRGGLLSAVDRMARSLEGKPLTRIHGDFHLGQILIAQNDAYLVDFEGEPLRPLTQRRRKSSPWRDVAGFLRSLDYAASVLSPPAEGGTGPGPDVPTEGAGEGLPILPADQAQQERSRVLLEQFRQGAGKAFLQAYRGERMAAAPQAGEQGVVAGEDGGGDEALLLLALLEKAAYELVYEAAHRPEYLPIPLAAFAGLAARILADYANGDGEGSRP